MPFTKRRSPIAMFVSTILGVFLSICLILLPFVGSVLVLGGSVWVVVYVLQMMGVL